MAVESSASSAGSWFTGRAVVLLCVTTLAEDMVLGTILSFVVSLLVGAAVIYAAAAVIADVRNYSHAVVTALVGAIAWGLMSLLFGWIPVFGQILVPIVPLLAYLWVINRRYPGGWIDAALIAGAAWIIGLLVLAVLQVAGLGVNLFGVPGV